MLSLWSQRTALRNPSQRIVPIKRVDTFLEFFDLLRERVPSHSVEKSMTKWPTFVQKHLPTFLKCLLFFFLLNLSLIIFCNLNCVATPIHGYKTVCDEIFVTKEWPKMSKVKCQVSNVKYQMSNVNCQISNVKCKLG